jgi:hypothetical protein
MIRKVLVWCALALLVAVPAFAQETQEPAEEATEAAAGVPSRMGAGVYVGYLTGELLSEQTFDGGTEPEMDDDALIGGVFYINTSDLWRFELRLTYSPRTILDTPRGEIDADLAYLDLVFVPKWQVGGWVLGAPFGAGWAVMIEDEIFSDRVPGQDISLNLEGGSGVTYFLGAQALRPVGENSAFVIDARLRRFHRLVNVTEKTVNSEEVTLGWLWSF